MPRSESGLVAVLLVTRSRPGPKLVFHYPLDLLPVQSAENKDGGGVDDSGSSSDEADILEALNGSAEQNRKGNVETAGHAIVAPGRDHTRLTESYRDTTPKKDNATPDERDVKETLLGFSPDSLEKLLCPGRWSHKKKFEVSLAQLTFLGYPVFTDPEEGWSGTPEPASVVENTHDSPSRAGTETNELAHEEASIKGGIDIARVTATQPSMGDRLDPARASDSYTQHGGLSLGTSFNSTSTTSGQTADDMTMFHVVLVVATDRAEQGQQMYHHVAKKLSKALFYCQKQANYVSSQSRRILGLRGKARQERTPNSVLWENICADSELSGAIKEVYDKISVGKIAAFRLNGMEMSLQVSRTGITPLGSADGAGRHDELGPHSGLLLLEERDVLLNDLSHPDASPLALFIQQQTPTKSLQKHAVNLSMPIGDIIYLARHLIKWRKARAIAPLHPRNMYTVNPSAPLQTLAEHIPSFSKRHAALPSLPSMLRTLSGRPIQYGLLIPSKDHRAPYMDMLAYLVRHNFVVQLKTFGWAKVLNQVQRAAFSSTRDRAESNESRGSLATSIGSRDRPTTSIASLLSPHLRPSDDDASSVSSANTAIPASQAQKLLGAKALVTSNTAENGHTENEAFTLVYDPAEPSCSESRCLDYMRSQIEDEELLDHWPTLLRILDGQQAFEEIAAREGLKRGKVEGWLTTLVRDDMVMTIRHW